MRILVTESEPVVPPAKPGRRFKECLGKWASVTRETLGKSV